MMKRTGINKIFQSFMLLMLLMGCNSSENVKVRTNVFVVPNPAPGMFDSMVYISYPINEGAIMIKVNQYFKRLHQQHVQRMSYSLKWKDGIIYRGQSVNDTIFYQKYIIPESRDTTEFNFFYRNDELFLSIRGKTAVIKRDSIDKKTFFQLFTPYEFEDSLRYTINDRLVIEEVYLLDTKLELHDSRVTDIHGDQKEFREAYLSMPEVFQN